LLFSCNHGGNFTLRSCKCVGIGFSLRFKLDFGRCIKISLLLLECFFVSQELGQCCVVLSFQLGRSSFVLCPNLGLVLSSKSIQLCLKSSSFVFLTDSRNEWA